MTGSADSTGEPAAEVTCYPFGDRIQFRGSGAVYWRRRTPSISLFIDDPDDEIVFEQYLRESEPDTTGLDPDYLNGQGDTPCASG